MEIPFSTDLKCPVSAHILIGMVCDHFADSWGAQSIRFEFMCKSTEFKWKILILCVDVDRYRSDTLCVDRHAPW